MNRERTRIGLVVLIAAALATPAAAQVDLVCPTCDASSLTPLDIAQVVDLVLSTLLQKGISLLVIGIAAVVGLPWLVAGIAVALITLPRRFKAST